MQMHEWNMGPFGMPWDGDIVEYCLDQLFACQKANFHDRLMHILTSVDTTHGIILLKIQLSCAKQNNVYHPNFTDN